jgi:hypothetical protein
VGVVSINCSLNTSLEYNQSKLSNIGEALTIYDYSEIKLFQQAHVGWFRKMPDSAWSSEDSYKLDVSEFSALSGKPIYLKISLISYPFGTPLEFDLKVLQNERIIAHESIKQTLQGTLFNDLEVFIPLSNEFNDNIFNLLVKAKSLAYQAHLTFPDATSFSNEKHMPFLIMTSLYEKRGQNFYALIDTESSLSDNSSCLDAPFTQGPSDTTGMNALGQKNDDFITAPACGSLNSEHSDSGPFMMSLCLGLFLSALSLSALHKSKKFLS